MKRVGFIGWRGMVGSVLMERMQAEGDFENIDAHFFSTSQAGQLGPQLTPGTPAKPLLDAHDTKALKAFDVLISCQGGDYTKQVYAPLRESGWNGYWIDAASSLRMDDDAIIVLDPVNRKQIDRGLQSGFRTFVGGNCTVSLMLMAIEGLLKRGWVEWVSSMTYQAASGAGAQQMRELVSQMQDLGQIGQDPNLADSILDLDRAISKRLLSPELPREQWGVALAGSLIPWIDRPVEAGQSREEWKGEVEANKILGTQDQPMHVDGTCVRIGAMRCHSQGLTIKLRKDVPLADIESALRDSHPWLRFVENEPEATRKGLTPAAVTGTLDIAVGRVRKMTMGPEYLNVFTVGDQLLWGAAEPLRRMLQILLEAKA